MLPVAAPNKGMGFELKTSQVPFKTLLKTYMGPRCMLTL